jgi:hypothetical protein
VDDTVILLDGRPHAVTERPVLSLCKDPCWVGQRLRWQGNEHRLFSPLPVAYSIFPWRRHALPPVQPNP